MIRVHALRFLAACAVLALPALSPAEESSAAKTYPDGHGGRVEFPLGDVSFADEVVSFQSGEPAASQAGDRVPEEALGVPDYVKQPEDNYLTLGCGGILTLRFVDNVLTDGPGVDLYVFEIGPAVEPMRLAISADGREWTDVGEISGGRAAVDISSVAEPDDFFYFVRLEDLRSSCENTQWPGADIDAVGAIGSALRFSLEGSVLFDFDRAELTAEATEHLSALAAKLELLAGARVTVAGHTDSKGSDAYNLDLSRRRAEAVRAWLAARPALSSLAFSTRAYGESRPVADNATDDGCAHNRRVELIVFPASHSGPDE